MKKIMALVLAAMMLLACCSALAEAPEGYPEVKEGIDLGGKDIYIYNYWDSADWTERMSGDLSDEQQAQVDYRHWIEKTYNCTIHEIMRGDWGTCAEEMTNFVSTPEDDKLAIFIIEPGKVGSLVANGMAAPIDYDTSAEKWNQADISLWSKDGQKYGLYTGASEPRQCLFFNKRILEEANIDWNTIYDAQKNGTWTWAMFEDMLKQVTKDTDNDGTYDVYGLIGSRDDMEVCAVFTNGGAFFDLDADGKLYPSMDNDIVKEALTWATDTWTKYAAPTPAEANWDWYKEGWKQGYCAFYMYQTYGGFNDNSEMADMEDEWGCVAFPVPKEGGNYITVNSDNITLIPSCYKGETVAQLAFIYDMWTNPTPGYEEDNWIGNKYNFTDERAVDETYAMLREPEHVVVNRVVVMGTQNDILGSQLLWSLGGDNTAAALIEQNMPDWQARCDTYNNAGK